MSVTHNLKPGNTKIITADAPDANHYSFKEWTGDINHITTGTAQSNPATITMPNHSVVVTATYNPYRVLTVNQGIIIPGILENVNNGGLYNWYAASDARKITSSDDWVVPTIAQIKTLADYLGASGNYLTNTVGAKLKEIGTTHWAYQSGIESTNETNFNGRGSGYRTVTFTSYSYRFVLASSSLYTNNISGAFLENSNNNFKIYDNCAAKKDGVSIRLIYVGEGNPNSYTGNDGKVYRVVKIGNQIWLADNLAEIKYRNNDYIHGFEDGIYTPISNSIWEVLTTEAMCIYDNNLNNV